ncbi:MAG: hypothetical protein IT281_06240 [Ignavibacteria bacterium]|nr:hypothetical protein [Ignavibacteria bacterium]
MTKLKLFLILFILSGSLVISGCSKEESKKKEGDTKKEQKQDDGHDHKEGDGHKH